VLAATQEDVGVGEGLEAMAAPLAVAAR